MPGMSVGNGLGASNRMPRRINSNLILNTVRRREPISRVDLSRLCGLQPSTVSLIVDELLRSHWLLEGEETQDGGRHKGARGRRPRLLTLSRQKCVVAIDIHPRQTTVGITELSGRIASQQVVTLPQDPLQAVERLCAAIQSTREANQDRIIDGIGICLPGRTDKHAQDLIFAPNMHWPAINLKQKIEHATGIRVEMDNVANACALSEVWFSESAEVQDLVVVEVSEGLGTGMFVNGSIARGRGGMAGEFGHIQMVERGVACNCGGHGCWETLASNSAALRYYRAQPNASRHATFSRILQLALNRDPAALSAVEEMARCLGRGMRMIAAAIAPAEIVVVGEVTAAWHAIGHTVEAELRAHPLARAVRLRPAYDGAAARLRSAVALVYAEPFACEPGRVSSELRPVGG